MQFAYPHNVWWSIAVAGVIWFGLFALYRRRQALRRLQPVGAAATGRRTRSRVRALVRSIAVILIGFTMLGPSWGERTLTPPPAKGRDLYILLDVSRSMLAEDVASNRLERSRKLLQDVAVKLGKRGGWRIGLIAFAERPVLLCPLTTDFRHFQEEIKNASLQSVRMREPEQAPTEGTQLGLALERVLRLASDQRELDVLLASDGGEQGPDEMAAITGQLVERGVRVYGLGVGDPAQGSPIPLRSVDGRRDVVRFQGEVVQTRLAEAPLQHLTQQTKGRYLRDQGDSVTELMAEITAKAERELPTAAQITVPVHRFQWFLLPALALLLLESTLGVRLANARDGVRPRTAWLARLVPPSRMKTASLHPATKA